MSEFKTGDRVRVVNTLYALNAPNGSTGTVVRITDNGVLRVKIDGNAGDSLGDGGWSFVAHRLKRLTQFRVGDKAVITTDQWDETGKVSPFRKGAVVEVTDADHGSRFPYTVKPVDGTPTEIYVREDELAPYVEPKPEPKFAQGDKVRVVFEGQVDSREPASDGSFRVVTDSGEFAWVLPERVEKIEPPEPPVEVFGPGDVVRRDGDGHILLLSEDGWFNTTHSTFYRSSMVKAGEFKSDAGFTRVKLAEVPF